MTDFNESITDAMDMVQMPRGIWEDTVVDAMSVAHGVLIVFPEDVEHVLSLADEADEATSSGLESDMDVGDAVGDNMVMFNVPSHALGLRQSVTAFVVSPTTPNDECDDAYQATANINLRDFVIFTWGVLTVQLRAPEFGNSMDVGTGALIRKNRGGEYRIQKPSSWPTVEILKMSFASLSQTDKDAFVDFLSQSAGYEIGFSDQEAVEWTGVILTPVSDVVQTVGNCSYNVNIEFRGVRS